MPASPSILPAPPLPRPIAKQLGDFDRYAVDIGGLRMHVMERGHGRPVICLHGNPTWGFLWRKVARALDPSRFRVIVPDLVGLGLSDKPRELAVHSLDNHIGWFGALIDQLELDQPAIFCGQDWGGPIGFGAYAERPAALAGLVILNTVVSPPKPGFRPTWFHRFARLPLISDAAFRFAGFPQAFIPILQPIGRSRFDLSASLAYTIPLANPRDNVAPLALARMVPDSLEHPSVPALERVHTFVKGFGGPVAVVWGTRDPILGGVLGWVEKQLPHARVWRTNAGHFLQEQVPEEIAQGIEHASAQA